VIPSGVLSRAAFALVIVAAARPAGAYEFEVRARTIAQGYELRGFRLHAPDARLARRRFAQALTLEIRDIGDLAARRARYTPDRTGPTVSFSSYLRLEHDFGDWTMGELVRDGRAIDAIDAIPELASSSLVLDLLYAHLDVDGLGGGVLDLRIGRQVALDLLDAWAFDGVTARVHTPGPVAIEVAGGVRVRDASPAGPAVYELDGTTGADCREYVEAAAPHTGRWQIIDRSRVPGQSRFTADLDYCPQREVAMPSLGVAVETEDTRAVHARLSYRRSMSRTVGVIGEVDRLDVPDVGLYPNEDGQAPGWGVNEERMALVVDGVIARGSRILVTPWGAARWSLLHGIVDQALAGARIRIGDHAIEPELARAVPTFDGDSIFNVFSALPSTDARVAWSLTGPIAARAGLWLRRYDLGDGDAARAGGITAAAQWQGLWRGDPLAVRVDGVVDGGWGGRRIGATVTARWRPVRRHRYGLRASVLDLADEPARGDPFTPGSALHATVVAGGTWQLVDGIAVHAVTEATSSRTTRGQARVLMVLDLLFVPEI
jgi:hypothetical protein